MKYLHVSQQPNGKKGQGVTYNVGRNAEKRRRRAAGLKPRAKKP